jgi:hypothetical protein
MKIFFSTVLICFALLCISSIEANACWCRKDLEETNTSEKLRKVVKHTLGESFIVFSGTFIEKKGRYLKFEAKKIWKGEEQTEIIFPSTNYFDSSGEENDFFIDSCAYYFKLGESYLVYATISDGNIEVSKCGRTQVLEEATTDVEILDLLKKPSK